MKTLTRSLLAALVCAFVLSLVFAVTATPALAQDTAQAAVTNVPSISPETAGAIAQPFIVQLALKYPITLTIIALIGSLRFFFKPVTSLVETYVRSTPEKTDDEYFDKVQHAKWFKAFAWVLDFGASIKVGPQFTAKPEKK